MSKENKYRYPGVQPFKKDNRHIFFGRDEDKQKLISLHAKPTSEEEVLWIKQMMKEHKTVEQSFELAQKLSHEAMQAVKDDNELVAILETMIKRSY